MYEVIISFEHVGKYESFKEAAIKFFEGIKAVLDKGASWQWLETMNFLVRTSPGESEGVMLFYDARDFACNIGLLKNGEIQPDVAEPAPEVVSQAYKKCFEEMELAQRQELVVMLEQLHKKIVDLSNCIVG